MESQKTFSFQIENSAIGVLFINDSIPVATGFVMGKPNWVITCAHVDVLAPGEKFFQAIGSKVKVRLKLLNVSYEGDIAIYEADTLISNKPLLMDTSFKFETKKTIVYLGFDQKLSTTVDTKILIRKSIIEAAGIIEVGKLKTRFIEFVGEGIPGYSGGPVFNTQGEVIAIFTQSFYRKGLKSISKEILVNRAFSIWPLSLLLKE